VNHPPRSSIAFLDSRSGRRVDALAHARLLVSSASLGWPGVLAEAGDNETWEVDDLTVAHHYLAMNTDAVPLDFEVRGLHGFRRVTLAPGSAWFCPAGEAFTHRVPVRCGFAAVSIDPIYLERLIGAERGEATAGGAAGTLRRVYGVRTPQIEHLVRALVAEADRGNPSGLPFVEALVTGLSLQIVHHAAVSAPRAARVRGGLSPMVRKRVLELIDARLDQRLSIEELAREADLSPSHFMRAFKQAVGRPTHQHILLRRLDRARRLLEQPGVSLSDVALRSGFSDQAHFTRLFKRQFGVTPGAVLRQRLVRAQGQ
jgi:AraC family transcriptional regulator